MSFGFSLNNAEFRIFTGIKRNYFFQLQYYTNIVHALCIDLMKAYHLITAWLLL
jgi:hypothetical protein